MLRSFRTILKTGSIIGAAYYGYKLQTNPDFSFRRLLPDMKRDASSFFADLFSFADLHAEYRKEEHETIDGEKVPQNQEKSSNDNGEDEEKALLSRFGEFDPNLPTYTLDEVIKHDRKETGIWVTFKSGVYDITPFVDTHPGGYDKIRLAFGGAIDPFWKIYGQHKVEHVLTLLEQFRIGNLSAEDAETIRKKESDSSNDIYANEPRRHPALVERSKKPYNAETPSEFLGGDAFYTPNTMFFVRNHLGVPLIDPQEYRLRISGIGIETREFTLEELRTLFPKKTVTTTIQCAGNRRDEMNRNTDKKVSGLVWDIGAIGNATFTGAPLKDILEYCGLQYNDDLKVEHVWFEGLDKSVDGVAYGASIPIDKAIDEKGDVILAYEMNGEVIPRDHGFPIRAVVPGVVGARNVKWLGEVIVSDEESPSHWQRRDYKGFGPNVPLDKIDWESAPSIQELPIQSAIAYPRDGQIINPYSTDELKITGYAYSGAGRDIIRVDVSTDGGKTWQQAKLKEKPIQERRNRAWSWTLWELPVPIPEDASEMEIVVKAVDSGYNVQPESSAPIWNARGVLSNAWHRVKVQFSEEV